MRSLELLRVREREKRCLYPALVAHCRIFRESPVLHNMATHIPHHQELGYDQYVLNFAVKVLTCSCIVCMN